MSTRSKRPLSAKVTIWMPPEVDAWLRATAKGCRTTKSELIRWFIRAGLDERRSRGVTVPRRLTARMLSAAHRPWN